MSIILSSKWVQTTSFLCIRLSCASIHNRCLSKGISKFWIAMWSKWKKRSPKYLLICQITTIFLQFSSAKTNSDLISINLKGSFFRHFLKTGKRSSVLSIRFAISLEPTWCATVTKAYQYCSFWGSSLLIFSDVTNMKSSIVSLSTKNLHQTLVTLSIS